MSTAVRHSIRSRRWRWPPASRSRRCAHGSAVTASSNRGVIAAATASTPVATSHACGAARDHRPRPSDRQDRAPERRGSRRPARRPARRSPERAPPLRSSHPNFVRLSRDTTWSNAIRRSRWRSRCCRSRTSSAKFSARCCRKSAIAGARGSSRSDRSAWCRARCAVRSAAAQYLQPLGQGGTVVFATVSGELHELGILMFAALAASRKLRACYLGADLPPGGNFQSSRPGSRPWRSRSAWCGRKTSG
jgi:hypothetical protein